MDNLNELGKELKNIREDADSALSRDTVNPPVTERVRDVFDAVRPFIMRFRIPDELAKVTLDLSFEDAIFSGSQDTCTDCYCVNIDQFTGGADGNLYTLDYIPIASTVRVYFGDYALQPGEKGFTVLGQNILINIPSVGYVITAVYLYHVRFRADGSPACTGGEDADGNPCTYSIDEFDNRVIPAGSTSLGESSSLANWGPIVVPGDPVTGEKKWMITKDTLLARRTSTGTNLGGGADRHLIVGGPYDGYVFRSLFYHDVNWDGVTKIVSAYLHLKNAGQIHITYTADPRVYTKRLTAAFQENNGVGSADGGAGWNGDPTDYDFTSWSDVGQGPVKDLAAGEGDWNYVDVTPFIEEIAPATVKRRNGNPGGARPNYGFVLREHNEYDGQRMEFYSSEHFDSGTDKRPHIDFTYLREDVVPGYAMVDNGIGTVYSPKLAYTGELTFDEVPNVEWPLILHVKFKFNIGKGNLDATAASEENGATFTLRGSAHPVSDPDLLYDVVYKIVVGWRVTADIRYPGQFIPQPYIKFIYDEEEPSVFAPINSYALLSINDFENKWMECKLYIDPIEGGIMFGKVWVTASGEPTTWKIGPLIKKYPLSTPQLPLPKGVSGKYFMKTTANITSNRVLDIEFFKLLCSYPVIEGARIIDNFGRTLSSSWGNTETPVRTWTPTSTGTGPRIYSVQNVGRIYVADNGGTAQEAVQFTHGQSFATLHRFKITSSVTNPATAKWKVDFKMGSGTYTRYWGIGGNTLAGANIRLYMGWKEPINDANYNDSIAFSLLLNNWYWAEWQHFEGIEQRLKIWLDSGTKPDDWILINNLSATANYSSYPASPMTSYGYRIIASASTAGGGSIDLNIDDLNIDYETS